MLQVNSIYNNIKICPNQQSIILHHQLFNFEKTKNTLHVSHYSELYKVYTVLQ